MGDFNASAAFTGKTWRDLAAMCDDLRLVSAYHAYYPSEAFGEETHPTHFHHCRASEPFHIDYCFVPEQWVSRLQSVTVGSFEDWRDLSDHMPVVVDLDL